MLGEPKSGILRIECQQGSVETSIADIGLEPKLTEFGGLDRKLLIYRMPDENQCRYAVLEHSIAITADKDNPLYVCVTTEDGHQAWSSPIYVISRPLWF